MDKIAIKNIFAAVNDKSVLDSLLKILDKKSVNFWGTDGTVKYLKSKGFKAKSVVFGFDFDGRLKSISREVFARVLADRAKKTHLQNLTDPPFDLVIVDLYKLEKKNFPESMDIGGVSLIRAAIKNFEYVALAFDQASIKSITSELTKQGSTSLEFRKKQAKSAAKYIAQRARDESKLFK